MKPNTVGVTWVFPGFLGTTGLARRCTVLICTVRLKSTTTILTEYHPFAR